MRACLPMTLFNSFVGTFGLLLLLTVGVTAWTFRSSSAPLSVKLIIPAGLVMLACFTPFRVKALMGYPTLADMRDLPQKAELLAFRPYDDDKRVDLWLQEGASQPRAYDILMTDEMKKTLRAAQGEQAQGRRVGLIKKGKVGRAHPPGYIDIDGGNAPYVLDPSAFSLPAKGDPQ